MSSRLLILAALVVAGFGVFLSGANIPTAPAVSPAATSAASDRPADAPEQISLSTKGVVTVTPVDSVTLAIPSSKGREPYSFPIRVYSSTAVHGRAYAKLSEAGDGDITVEPTLAIRDLSFDDGYGRLELEMFADGTTLAAVKEALRARHGREFHVQSPSITSLDVRICDGGKELASVVEFGTLGGTVTLHFAVDQALADRLAEAYTTDRLSLRWFYTVDVRKTIAGSSFSAVESDAKQAARTFLQDKSGGQHSAQSANSLARQVQMSVESGFHGDIESIEYLKAHPLTIHDMFDTIRVEWTNLEADEFERLAKVLEGYYGERITDKEVLDRVIKSDTDLSASTNTLSGGLILLSGTSTDTATKAKGVYADHGIVMRSIEGGKYWTPHHIERYSFNEQRFNAALRQRQSFVGNVGDVHPMKLPGRPVATWMKADLIADALRSMLEQEAISIGLPRGICLPYFGDSLPVGWVWADGQSFWPDEPWVVAELRNRPVPDMRGRLIGGAIHLNEAGTVAPAGELNFSTPGASPQAQSVPNVIFWRAGAYRPETILAHGNNPLPQLYIADVTIQTVPYPGAQEISIPLSANPAHLRANFIIRMK